MPRQGSYIIGEYRQHFRSGPRFKDSNRLMGSDNKLKKVKTAKDLKIEVGCQVSVELNPKKKQTFQARSEIRGWEEGKNILLNTGDKLLVADIILLYLT